MQLTQWYILINQLLGSNPLSPPPPQSMVLSSVALTRMTIQQSQRKEKKKGFKVYFRRYVPHQSRHKPVHLCHQLVLGFSGTSSSQACHSVLIKSAV